MATPTLSNALSQTSFRRQNFTNTAKVIRFSNLRRSGKKPGTNDPGGPVLPPGGVTPPSPAKYGTLAARWLYSARNVTNWLGMKSMVVCTSHALNGSPGASVKYGVPENAVAPLIGGGSPRGGPGFLIAPPPTVMGGRWWSSHTRLYAMNPIKVCDGVSAVPPPQVTPPPYSQPASNVSVN